MSRNKHGLQSNGNYQPRTNALFSNHSRRGAGTKLEMTTDGEDIGELLNVELLYYGFNSFYIHNVRVNILHRNEM